MRVTEGAFKVQNDGSGEAGFHSVEAGLAQTLRVTVEKADKHEKASKSAYELETVLRTSFTGVGRLHALSEELGLPLNVLGRMKCGWIKSYDLLSFGTKCSAEGAYTFPMIDRDNDLCGFRLRCDGFKYSLSGGRNGFFAPSGLNVGDDIVIVEGPTDTAAALAFGLQAIGRPNNNALPRALAGLVSDLNPASVRILMDNDDDPRVVRATLQGAGHLARMLRIYCETKNVTIWKPKSCKDIREMWRQGASPEEELEIINE
jgi:hypothetical protein